MRHFRRLVTDKRAVTCLEYSLIAACIAATGIYGITQFAISLSAAFVAIGTSL